MSDEIREILDKFDKVLENYELDKKFGQMSVDSICHLFPSEMTAIKDYITNLQHRIEYLERSNNRREDTIMGLRDEIVEYEDYKSRIDKVYKITTEFENWLQDSDLVARATIIDLICDIQKALTSGDE